MRVNKFLKLDFTKNIIHSFLGQSSYSLLTIGLTFFIARFFGAELFGRYTYIITLVMFISTFVKVGMDNSLIYFIAKNKTKYISVSFLIAVILSAIIITVIYVFSKSTDLKGSIFLILVLACQDLFFGIYKSYGKIKEYFLVKSFIVVGLHIILVLITYLFLNPSFFFLVLGFYISNSIALVIFIVKNKEKFGPIKFNKEYLRYSFPMMFTSMMGILMNRIDILMIGNMMDMKSVGIYRVVVQIATATSLITAIFNIAFAPKIAQLFQKNRLEELKKIYIKSTRVFFVLGVFVLLIVLLYSNFLLQLFGQEYVFGNKSLILRTFAQFFTISVGSVGFMLSMIGKVDLQLYRVTIAASINIILNLFLIPVYGIEGAAFSSMCALFISSILGYFFVNRELKIKVFKYI